jgi:hypothetical protein
MKKYLEKKSALHPPPEGRGFARSLDKKRRYFKKNIFSFNMNAIKESLLLYTHK